jgi:hypothetical protein
METILIAALTAAFVVSAVDYWQHLSIYRGVIAFIVSGLAVWAMGVTGVNIPIYGAAAAFTAISAISLIDRAISVVSRVR